MNPEEFSSYDLKRCVLKIRDMCTGGCSSCLHKEVVRDELIARNISPQELLKLDEIPPEIQHACRSASARIGEIVEDGIGGCDHTDLRRNIPLTRQQLQTLNDDL